ncbi:MAG: hypothetical protein DRJ47_10815, partial [Thermoprotei archaeon]
GLSSELTYGRMAVNVLKEIVRVERMKPEELERKLNISMGTIIESLNLLSLYGLVTKDYDGSYRPSEYLRRYRSVLERVEV